MLKIITTTNDPTNILATRCDGITNNEICALGFDFIAEFIDTMMQSGGIGLAAPQVGISKRFFCMNANDGIRMYYNPSFKTVGNKRFSNSLEGCLSVPGKSKVVLRHCSIVATWRDPQLELHTQTLTGLDAFVFQHELDHLNGIHI